MFYAWLMFGAIVGILASLKRGFSPVLGLLLGAFLGILAPLLFAVSGITSRGDLSFKVCPHCAERIKPAANVCKHCGRSLTAQPEGPQAP